MNISSAVAHEHVVDGVVAARGNAVNPVAARPHAGVDARAALGADALGGFEEPCPHLEAERLFGERADGAAVHYVEQIVGVVVVAVDRDFRLRAALCEPEDALADELVAETYAARALYAPFAVQNYLAGNLDLLGLYVFALYVARLACPVPVCIFLELALARLVAYRAVEGVV